MKNFLFLFLIISFIFISSNSFCKEVTIIKQGGVRKVLTFWKVTYDVVEYIHTSTTTATLRCINGGYETCRKPTLYGSIIIDENEYYEKVVDGVFNEIMDLVDQSIFDGNESGSISKKISTKTIDGKEMILAFTAAWSDADVEIGDVKYIIRINEIEL